ncbi:MAG: response regulator [Desulfobacterales bacterium]|nr:response regulator [Desulfobacterales bacterium]
MRVRIIVILLTLPAILFPFGAFAGSLDDLDVLADVESQAITMIQDGDGFLWIGTYVDGVYRYDGKQLKHFNQASGLILANNVPAILEDRNGHLWFAAGGGGLTRFDKETNQVSTYAHDADDPATMSTNALFWSGKTTLMEDRDGDVWIGTIGGGLNRFDRNTRRFIHYRHHPEDPKSLGSDNIRALFEDSLGTLWVGTEAGLDRFDKATGTAIHYRPDPHRPGSISGETITVIFEDDRGDLWAGTDTDGLNRFDRDTETFRQYRNEPQNPFSLESDQVIDLFQDDQQRLWIAHASGLTFYDLDAGVFHRYTGPNKDITRIMSDRNTSAIWALTDSGKIGRFNSGGKRFSLYRPEPGNPDSLSSEIVVTIYEDRHGILWIATLGGLNRFDPQSGRFRRYMHQPADPETIPSPIDYSPGLFEDSSGTFWIGGSMPATLSIFDRASGKVVKTYRHVAGDPWSLPQAQQVNRIRQDRNDPDILWLSTTHGLARFHKKTERFVTYGRNDSWDVYEDAAGAMWLSTWGNGLARFDPKTGTFAYHRHDPADPGTISDNTLVPLFEDSSGRLWIGTENGLNRYNRENGRFTRYTRSDGYPWDAVHSIGEDRQGNLWLGTNDGLARFDPATEKARIYGREDGLQGAMFYALNGIMDRDGRMWFGGTKGMNSFVPEMVADNSHLPEIRLTSLKQGGVEVDFGKAPERLRHITLDWRNNFFEFEFAALDFANPEKNQYAYMLQGLDNDWYVSGTRNFGRYAGLAPGSYTLRMRGANNDGAWNEKGASLKIVILPPFWRTGWFFILLLLAALTMIGIVFFYMVRLNEEVKERQRAESGLKESNARLESLNRQLQRLDQLKDEFLANTSHELRTPLTGIIGLAESLMDGVAGPLNENAVANLSMIVTSGQRLANLVNDILDFSRLRHRDLILVRRPVDLFATVDVVLAISRPLTEGRTVMLDNRVPADLPSVDADENRLQQILFNLVGNAVKFTETGAVTVSARIQDGMAKISVIDTGIGIPQDRLEGIFESFEQVDGSIARQYGGTGLGLAVTRQLVELHGGFIHVESQAGKGSVFRFTLPLADGKAVTETVLAQNRVSRVIDGTMDASDSMNLAEGVPSGPTILVVDDEPVNLQVLTNHLSMQNYRVTQVTGGQEALNIIDDMAAGGRRFDLVLLDVMMPKMSGYEVCQRLREKFPPDALPVVMLTAKNRVEDLVAGLEAGANDYLTKPFSKAELLARIRNHAALKNLNDRRRESEAALAASERKYRELFEAMPDVIYRVDMKGRLIMASPAITRVLGYDLREVEGQPIADMLYLEPDRRGHLLERLAESGSVEGFEVALKHKSGRVVWVSANTQYYRGAEGTPLGIEGIFRDITDQKKAEENYQRLSTVVEQAAELIVITDTDGVIQYVNPAFESATGYGRTEVIGKTPRLLNSGKHDQAFFNDMWQTITGGGIWKGRMINRKKDGTLYEEDATISPIRDHSGHIVNFVAVKRDITREIVLESQLLQAQKMESIGTLAGGIAHDFNNILSAIIGYTEISMHDTASDSVRGSLTKVLQAGQRAKDLVNQILAFSRQSAVEPRPAKVRLIVKEVLKLLRASLPATIEIRTDILSEATVMADPIQLHQVMMNLCTNASHAMGETGGWLTVGLHDAAPAEGGDGDRWVRLTIRDTGCGISQKVIERIFDPFFTTKEKGVGTGMGLSVVHGIVAGLNGRINLASEVGKGSTFTVFLPALLPEKDAVAPPAEALVFGTERILFVDDEPFQVDLGRQILQRLGYRVTTETRSARALERFRQDPDAFDLIITDMTMPELTGDRLAEALMAIRPDIPVILCTGYSERITGETAAAMGIRGFAIKPVVMKDIAKLIREVLDGDS